MIVPHLFPLCQVSEIILLLGVLVADSQLALLFGNFPGLKGVASHTRGGSLLL